MIADLAECDRVVYKPRSNRKKYMPTHPIRIIGIDCATDPTNVGLALGTVHGQDIAVHELTTGTKDTLVAAQIAEWLQDDTPTLLALDSPLGWPAQLGNILHAHEAGDPIELAANSMFRRATDRFIREKLSKQPLEVAADRIARTAHAALALLAELRIRTGQAIPLAWQAADLTHIHAIEVYPAATLRAYGYRKPTGEQSAEQAILALLARYLTLPTQAHTTQSRHAIDAAACVLAGADFIRGYALPPEDLTLAKKESWIWARARIHEPES